MADRITEIERSAERWKGNSAMWTYWNNQLMGRGIKARVQHWLSKSDDGFNHSSMAWAFNLCFILAGVIVLICTFIFRIH